LHGQVVLQPQSLLQGHAFLHEQDFLQGHVFLQQGAFLHLQPQSFLPSQRIDVQHGFAFFTTTTSFLSLQGQTFLQPQSPQSAMIDPQHATAIRAKIIRFMKSP